MLAVQEHLRNIYLEFSRDYVQRVLRSIRPLPERYFLEQAALYEELESCSDMDHHTHREDRTPARGLLMSPDPRFIHRGVLEWIQANSLEWISVVFEQLGIYQHEDVVNVACCMRRSGRFRQELQRALDLDSARWLSVESALMRYARPIKYPFVKALKVQLNAEGKNEDLFDEVQWNSRMREVETERTIWERERDDWVDSVIAREHEGARDRQI